MKDLSNGFGQVPALRFDTVVSNLPAKAGNEMLSIILHEARDHLREGGRFYVVTISGLKGYIKRNFREIFGNYKKVKQGKTYTVSLAVRECRQAGSGRLVHDDIHGVEQIRYFFKERRKHGAAQKGQIPALFAALTIVGKEPA